MVPDGFADAIRSLLGAEADEFFAAYDRPRAVGLRKNPLKGAFPAAPELDAWLTGPVPWARNGFYYDPAARPGLHPWHEAGLYYLQEPSAMAPAELLDPQPGERVLDLCAAPGGKTTQLAALMGGRGLLVANEYHPARAKILSRNVERMAVPNALVTNERPDRLARRLPDFFDRVLVDAPCSGEGMFRKEEAAVADWSPEQVLACARRQAEILDSAAALVAPGGRLVYSTCTFSAAENEDTVAAFLRRHSDFSPEILEAPWFSPGSLPGTFRLWPHRLRGEGHFAAVLRRAGEGRRDAAAEPSIPAPAEFAEFSEGLTLPPGRLIAFGPGLYLAPEALPVLAGLRVLRPGLELGQCKKGRFEPAHALALALRSAPSEAELDAAQTAAYLRGETVPGDPSGWTLVKTGGVSLGWAKGSGGVLKNHYPKGLRRP